MDKKKMGAVAAIPAVLTFGALGFTQQQGTAQHTGSAAQAGQQAENSAADPDKTSSRVAAIGLRTASPTSQVLRPRTVTNAAPALWAAPELAPPVSLR